MTRISGYAATHAAMQAEGVPARCRPMLEAICSHIDDSAECFPSITTLARESGRGRSSAIEAINRLVDSGYVLRTGVKYPGGPQVYRVNLEKLGLAPVVSAVQSQPADTTESVVAPKDPTRTKGFYPAPRPAPGGSADYAEVLQRLSGIEQAVALLTQMVASLSEYRSTASVHAVDGEPFQTEFVFHEVSEADFFSPPIPAEWNDIPEGVKPVWSAEDCETFTMGIPFPLVPATGGSKTRTTEQLYLGLGDSTPKPAAKPVQKPTWDEEDGWRRFWAVYPNHKEEREARRNFHTRFARLAQPEALLQRMLGVIGQMRRAELWIKDDGKYVHLAKNFLGRNKAFERLEEGLRNGDYEMTEDYDPARPEYLQRSPAEDAELVARMETGKAASAPAAPKPVRQWTKKDWGLCSERCANYDPEKGCCRCGVKAPPEHDPLHVHPPEECKHFERIDGQEPTPRTLDALMNEAQRPAARTGVRGVKSLASVFGGPCAGGRA